MKEMIRKLKFYYKEHHGVYIYRCYKNKCRAWMDFSIPKCEKCGAENYYFESESNQDKARGIELRVLLKDVNLNIDKIKTINENYDIIEKEK